MPPKEKEKEDKRKAAAAAERAARERYDAAVIQIREASYRFLSKVPKGRFEAAKGPDVGEAQA